MSDKSKGRESEFVRLLSKHSSQIYGFILMLSVSRSDADDVFQDTSVIMWEKFSGFEPGTSFKAWACRIAYLEVLSRRRSSNRVKYLSDSALTALANDALVLMQQEDYRKDALADCLSKLAERDRTIIEQKYFVHLTAEEIADRSSRSVYSIYRALGRIHGVLLRCIQRDQRV